MNQDLKRAIDLAANAQRVVVLTGAGFSRPSGIPDFRSPEGLWSRSDPAEVASLHAFRRDPDGFYRWFKHLLEPILAARPNAAHLAVSAFESAGRVTGVITQNIDGLHQQAGSRRVYELHGHLRSATCFTCERQVPSEHLLPLIRQGRAPRCTCGGVFKPDVVLFDEALPRGLLWLAHALLEQCDLLIVAGTSLEVAPVCDLPLIALRRGARLIIVNLEATYLDARADAVIRDDVATVIPAIVSGALARAVG